MDSTSIKKFNLNLLEGLLRDTLNNFLVTASKQTDTIIDIISYNEFNNELLGLYSHSSKGNRDGIRVEFSRDISTSDSIQIQMLELEIPESSGKIEVHDVYLDENQIFDKLSHKEHYLGKYEFITDSTSTSLHIFNRP